jgi:TIR domain/VHL beta domain
VENQTDVSGNQGTAHHGPRIFLNYRRKDTEDTAGRLFDSLCAHFGEHHVFMDIDDIQPGVDFDEVVHEAVGNCDVLLALIGPAWLTMVDEHGRRRLDDPDDYVRIELQVALQRNIRVVPVLIHDVGMPRGEDLPDGLQRLSHKQAVSLSNARWKSDIASLIEALESVRPGKPYASEVLELGALEQPAPPKTAPAEPTQTAPGTPPPSQKPVRRKRRRWLWAAGAIVAILVIIAAASGGSSGSHSTTTGTNAASHAASIGITVTGSCTGASIGNETQAATISWLNSTKSPAKIYWLTYGGARDLYDTLAPGQSYSQQTYVGHRWLVVESGACSAMTVTKPGTQTFTIH